MKAIEKVNMILVSLIVLMGSLDLISNYQILDWFAKTEIVIIGLGIGYLTYLWLRHDLVLRERNSEIVKEIKQKAKEIANKLSKDMEEDEVDKTVSLIAATNAGLRIQNRKVRVKANLVNKCNEIVKPDVIDISVPGCYFATYSNLVEYTIKTQEEFGLSGDDSFRETFMRIRKNIIDKCIRAIFTGDMSPDIRVDFKPFDYTIQDPQQELNVTFEVDPEDMMKHQGVDYVLTPTVDYDLLRDFLTVLGLASKNWNVTEQYSLDFNFVLEGMKEKEDSKEA